MSDIIENEESDRDTVEQNVMEQLFSKKYNLLTETTVSLKKTYINQLSGTKSLKFAVILPDKSIEVYELNNTSLARVCHLIGHEKNVTEVVFNPRDDNILFSSSEDGLVKMWDIRASGTFVLDYKDEEEEMVRPFECMDVSHNGRVLCAGSQVVEDDAYLVFWDQRAPKPLGGYWNSHTDDITQVKFHKEKMEILATGSLDGLVNIFDITEQTESDALTYSLNTENAVDKISWLDETSVAVLTQSNRLQVWDTRHGDLISSYTREKVARSIKRSRADDCYLVDAFLSADGEPVLLAGSYGGDEDTLRSVRLAGQRLLPRSNFRPNKQIVRSCWCDDDRDLLVTAGESGVISVWKGVRLSRGDVDREESEDSDDSEDETMQSSDTQESSEPCRAYEQTSQETQDTQDERDVHSESDSTEAHDTQTGEAARDPEAIEASPGKLSDALAKLRANRYRPY